MALPVDQASPQLLWGLASDVDYYLILVWISQPSVHSDSFSRLPSYIPSSYFGSLWGLLSLFCPLQERKIHACYRPSWKTLASYPCKQELSSPAT